MWFEKRWHVVAFTSALMLVCQLATMALIFLAYEPELRPLVAVRVPIFTALLVLIYGLVAGWMLHRHALQRRRLQDIVNRDRLTDAATRDYFFNKMEANPHAHGVMLVVDIDHFKAVNDAYGHPVGDRVLRHVAQLLLAELRAEDIICRLGGEEFVIFLADADAAMGESMAELLRATIADAQISDGATHIPVTVSIGGSIKARACGIEDALRDADAALYRAKRGGRNQVVLVWRDAAHNELAGPRAERQAPSTAHRPDRPASRSSAAA